MTKKGLHLILMTAIAGGVLAGCGTDDDADSNDAGAIGVGWTADSENAILGNMAALLLEDHLDVTVEESANLGGTGLAHDSIIAGEIDIYVDYTGDALANVLDLEPIADSQEAFDTVNEGFQEEFDITWLAPTDFNNTYAITVHEEHAEATGAETISDLEPYAADWVLGSSIEFANREIDGYPGLIEHYGFEFGENRPMDTGLMYVGAAQGELDAIAAFATDARIEDFNLKVLEDDLEFFPSYNAAPTVRNEVLEEYPEIEELFNNVFGGLDAETIISLNGQVDTEEQNPSDVAEAYLLENDYIES